MNSVSFLPSSTRSLLILCLVNHDAAHIKALTKSDMIAFYNQYILPSSAARSKLAIHLHAQANTTGSDPQGLTSVLEKGVKALGLNKAKNDGEDEEGGPSEIGANGTTPVVITDVREFKSKLQISAGPQPVKHISEFEELDSKL